MSSSQAERNNRQCANRAQWRVPPGKSAERLSPYYQLGCDFGGALIASWSTDGTEPIYLCEQHAKQMASSAPSARVRSVGQYEDADIDVDAGPVSKPLKPLPAPAVTKNANSDRKPATPTLSPAERCAEIERQINELGAQLEGVLSQSEAAIDVASTIDAPLEQVILEIIGHPAMSDALKDAAITRLGEIQRSLKQVACNGMTLLEAHRIKQSLAGCLGSEIGMSDEAKAAYRAVHDSIEKAIQSTLSQTANSLVGS